MECIMNSREQDWCIFDCHTQGHQIVDRKEWSLIVAPNRLQRWRTFDQLRHEVQWRVWQAQEMCMMCVCGCVIV
eukprot:12427259-Karenia_brevis.AAC.1